MKLAWDDLHSERPFLPRGDGVAMPSLDLSISAPFPETHPPVADIHQRNSGDPRLAVHTLLFILEFTSSNRSDVREKYRCLHFFFSRHNGMHLLLTLLNAFYHKPPAGRRAGWVFSALAHRLNISERGLRILVQDAVAEGLIEVEAFLASSDRRCRSYKLSGAVVAAWEDLVGVAENNVSHVFTEMAPGFRANIDYREWEPDLPAQLQRHDLPPHRRRPKETP